MTDRIETPSKESSVAASLAVQFSLIGIILAIFTVNLFILEPVLSHKIGERGAQAVYVLIRIGGLLALAFFLAKNAKRNRFQVISTVLLVGFIDQVFVKGFWLKGEMQVHPADWVGVDPSNSAIFLNMALGYLFFIPLILVLAFVGMEATRFRKDWKLEN